MKTVAISDFKARCIAILREAQRTGEPVTVTRRDKPIARIEPIQESDRPALGLLRGRMKIHGDLVQADWAADWEMLS